MDQSTKEYIDAVLAKALSAECRAGALTSEAGALLEMHGLVGRADFKTMVEGAYQSAMTDAITQLNPLNKPVADILEGILKQSIEESLKIQ